MHVDMRLRAVLLTALLGAAGCYPTVTAGYDTTSTVRGPLAPFVSTRPDARNYAFGVGGGARDFTLEVGVQPRAAADALVSPAAQPSARGTAPRYLISSGSLDLRWTAIRYHMLSANLHIGPAVGGMVDRARGDFAFAQGFRSGTGVALSWRRITAFVDYYYGALAFSDGPAAGTSHMSGITVGVGIR